MRGEKGKLNEQQVDALLDKLGSDDAFRERFVRDGVKALDEIGFKAPGDALPTCLQTTELASKEEINAARDTLRAQLTAQGSHIVIFCIEAGKVQGAPDQMLDRAEPIDE